MNANLKLLAKDYPRSPRETLAGYVIAARMLDKCRAVGEATVNQAVAVGHLNNQSSRTRNLKLFDRDKSEVREIINRSPDLGKNRTRIFRGPRPTSFMPCGISLQIEWRTSSPAAYAPCPSTPKPAKTAMAPRGARSALLAR